MEGRGARERCVDKMPPRGSGSGIARRRAVKAKAPWGSLDTKCVHARRGVMIWIMNEQCGAWVARKRGEDPYGSRTIDMYTTISYSLRPR